MRAITTSCLLLLASACAWHRGDAAVLQANDNFGIFGGTPVNITEVPYMAQFITTLRGGIEALCGACIVHEQFLVTAGHCVFTPFKKRKVIVGTDRTDSESYGEECEVEKVFRHPKFFENMVVDYDMAVIKLKKKLVLSERVKPVKKMADSSLVIKPGEIVTAMGFGLTEHGTTSQLLKVNLPFINRTKCEADIQHEITERMICAGGEKGKGVCDGDSGGPVVYGDTLVGLPSWLRVKAKVLCAVGFPDVYSNLASMRDFIDGVIKNNTS